MLAVLNRYRYRIFLIILALFLLAILLWLHISGQGKAKAPSRGVFVMEGAEENLLEKECEKVAEGDDKGGV